MVGDKMIGIEEFKERVDSIKLLRENVYLLEKQLREDLLREITSPMLIDGWRKILCDMLINLGTSNRKENLP